MRNIFLLIYTSIMLFFTACSTNQVQVKPTIVFPAYPEEPRILFLDTYRGGTTTPDTSLTQMINVFLGESESEKAKSSYIIKPYGVGILGKKLYVADPASGAVFIIDENSREADFIGTGVVGRLSKPTSVAFDKNGIVYVSDSQLKTIQGYDSNGTQVFALGGRLEFTNPTGIAIDEKSHRLYVIDTKAHHIKCFDIESKKLIFTIGKRGTEDGEFNFPTNAAVDRRNGNIIVCDTQNFRVQIFDKDGNFIRRFGKVGDRPGDFARPKGVAVDSEGNIYVNDSAFSNTQIFNENGELLMWFGSAGYGDTQYRLITGIYIDKEDKIIIADGFSGRAQTYQYISKKWREKNPQKYEKLKNFKIQKQ